MYHSRSTARQGTILKFDNQRVCKNTCGGAGPGPTASNRFGVAVLIEISQCGEQGVAELKETDAPR
jgi:hypothetical protein